MSSNLNEAAAAPAALSAFLRGAERRGALFAELQCGDQEAGDAALAATMRAFRTRAGALPMAEWPRRFWALLVANPQLRQPAPTARWPQGLGWLASLATAHRQALLLRLAAGLPEADAAAVLGTDLTAYEQALAAACPREPAGGADPVAWRALAETIQQQLRDLPPARLARLAGLREAAITGARVITPGRVQQAKAPRFADQPRAHRRWPWVLLVLALCAVALAATWWWPPHKHEPQATPADGVQRLADEVDVQSEALPEHPAAARFDDAAALLLQPDFEQLADPEAPGVAQDADFLAWVAADADQSKEEAGAGEGKATAAHDPSGTPPGTETADAHF